MPFRSSELVTSLRALHTRGSPAFGVSGVCLSSALEQPGAAMVAHTGLARTAPSTTSPSLTVLEAFAQFMQTDVPVVLCNRVLAAACQERAAAGGGAGGGDVEVAISARSLSSSSSSSMIDGVSLVGHAPAQRIHDGAGDDEEVEFAAPLSPLSLATSISLPYSADVMVIPLFDPMLHMLPAPKESPALLAVLLTRIQQASFAGTRSSLSGLPFACLVLRMTSPAPSPVADVVPSTPQHPVLELRLMEAPLPVPQPTLTAARAALWIELELLSARLELLVDDMFYAPLAGQDVSVCVCVHPSPNVVRCVLTSLR